MKKVLESYYKMRDTLIAEGYSYTEDFEPMLEIEKSLLVLEIIKEKQVNCYDIINSVDYKHYLVLMKDYDKSWQLPKEEYNLLKEVLS